MNAYYWLAIVGLIVLVALLARCAKQAQISAGEVKYDEVHVLPIGIRVTHTPNPAPAVKGGPSGHAFSWIYETRVEATEQPLTIVEFGVFVWHKGRWQFATYTGEPFTPEDFEEWYSCPGAIIEPGISYVDPGNWSGGQTLQRSKAMWYYVAEDSQGNRYRGTAVIEELGRVTEEVSFD